jgi:hypothetical protein
MRHARPLVVLAVLLGTVLPASIHAQPACTFVGDFQALHEQLPEVVGDCLEDEHPAAGGNVEQRTTGGVLVWRQADNLITFTDGETTWLVGPEGLVSRPNDGPPFPWETAAVPAPAAGPEAAVLFTETFDEPAASRFPPQSTDPRIGLGFVDGEYRVAKLEPNLEGMPFLAFGEAADATIAVDARLVGGADQRFVAMGCRKQPSPGGSEYRFVVVPAVRQFALLRMDDEQSVPLASMQESAAINPGEAPNRLELRCAGSTIAAAVNGTPLTSVQDATYQHGRMWFGASSFVGVRVAAEGRFDNLVVTEAAP